MPSSSCFLFVYLLLVCVFHHVTADCSMLNYCNGHGTCNHKNSTCSCFRGYGHRDELFTYRAPDCSVRTCPTGKAWGALPTSSTNAHGLAECSNMGLCNRRTGDCECMAGFSGRACERKDCPHKCSGHGRCVSMRRMAMEDNAYPVSPNTVYEIQSDGTAWDSEMIYGCVCESAWVVGLGADRTQEAEYFGNDCSLRHCPSGSDPMELTIGTGMPGRNASDCHQAIGLWGRGVGKAGAEGNLCQVDCSNRGVCNYKTGVCSCFNNYYGSNCGVYSP